MTFPDFQFRALLFFYSVFMPMLVVSKWSQVEIMLYMKKKKQCLKKILPSYLVVFLLTTT